MRRDPVWTLLIRSLVETATSLRVVLEDEPRARKSWHENPTSPA